MAEAYFAFTCQPASDEFVFRLTDDAKIEEARKILRGEQKDRIHVLGRLIKRPASYNPGWSYHLDPTTISFFEMAIEVCDAGPTYVEDHLDEACGAFLPGCIWCPWSSVLTREVNGATAAGATSSAPATLQAKTLSNGWPALKGTAFASGIDAVCGVPDNATDLYLFKGDQYLRYKVAEEKIASGPKSLADGWAGLKGTAFANGIDAASLVPDNTTDVYLFKGDQYLRYRTGDEKIASGPKSLTDGWAGLKGTAFANGISAACSVPGEPTSLYLFKDDQYVLYRTRDEKITSGPKSLASLWGIDGVFAKGVDDACRVPGGTGDLYFFKGDQYVRVR
ncbi:hemopexin repeat-containing protein [Streptomyces sp. NRRL B-24484]|uniref:BP74-related protein n=1 Tax=Streptomyces sp. NRRL B-24484 TaxID=1463833 RepID=UPI0007C52A13|nr:hemopexin repeat-containing protein [Streptomyces sp. NRRL B-24484]